MWIGAVCTDMLNGTFTELDICLWSGYCKMLKDLTVLDKNSVVVFPQKKTIYGTFLVVLDLNIMMTLWLFWLYVKIHFPKIQQYFKEQQH